MKKLLTVLLILSFTYPHSATAYDGGYTGTIALLHFNSDIAGRGVCESFIQRNHLSSVRGLHNWQKLHSLCEFCSPK